MDTNTAKALIELRLEIKQARKSILDLLELAFGDHPKWPAARTCVLRALGQSGLEGFIEKSINQSEASDADA